MTARNKKKNENNNDISAEVISAIAGGTFFAVPFLALNIALVPSLIIGASAFAAGELVFHKDNIKNVKIGSIPLNKLIQDAVMQNERIRNVIPLIDDEDLRISLTNINKNVTKIIDTIEEDPNKIKKVHNFFDYYLPITVTLAEKYDKIENQRLSSIESQKLKKNTIAMLKKIDKAFSSMLNGLYENDMIDMDAEMKVFDSMLKSDGLDDNKIEVKKEDE